MSIIVDTFCWSYEEDAVRVRLAELAETVDYFVAVQGTTDFRGNDRDVQPAALLDNLPPGVRERIVDVTVDLPTGPSVDTWARERALRNAQLTEAVELFGTSGTTMYLVSDGDEIPRPETIARCVDKKRASVLGTDYREWFMDYRQPWSDEEKRRTKRDEQLLHQPVIGTWRDFSMLGGAAEARRLRRWRTASGTGWHLSTLGDGELARRKLMTYSHTEMDTGKWRRADALDRRRAGRIDMFERFPLAWTDDVPSCWWQFTDLVSPEGVERLASDDS